MIRGENILTLSRPPADFVQVIGNTLKGFTLNYYDDEKGSNFISKKIREMDSITHVLTAYLKNDPNWSSALSLRSSATRQHKAQRRIPGMAGIIAFGIFGTAYLAAGIVMWINRPPGFTGRDYALGWVGIAVIAGYIGWINFFFSSIRPRLARSLSAKLGVDISESMNLYDAGTWNAMGGHLGSRLLVYALDIVILLLSLMLPVAIPAVIIFILFAR
jgi:hypothetical protein